jgi:hypothetical protein
VPWLEAVDGGRVARLPKPTKKDDPAKVEAALARFEALSLDLDDVRQAILVWFERALAIERAWSVARFQRAIVEHPLLSQVARRLVWSADGRAFRVSEDGSFADHDDAALALPEDARVMVLHPVRLGPERHARFRQLLHDYAVIQPFEQLERAVFRLEPAELATTELPRFQGRVVATARRNALLGARGWQHGPLNRMHKPLGRVIAELVVDGTSVHTRGATAADRLGVVRLVGGETFSALTDVEASELLRDLEELPTA